MSASVSSEEAGARDSERHEGGLARNLKDSGVDSATVDRFIQILAVSFVTTQGALRLFADDLPALIDAMFEGEEMAGLKSKGFLAAVRVHASDTPHCLHCPRLSMSF
jgi:hypothetical protein